MNIHLKTLLCFIIEGQKRSTRENLIKFYLQAFLCHSVRLIPGSLPCHPVSVRWMKAQRSRRCQTIPQQSPKWKAALEFCIVEWYGRKVPFPSVKAADPIRNLKCVQVSMFPFAISTKSIRWIPSSADGCHCFKPTNLYHSIVQLCLVSHLSMYRHQHPSGTPFLWPSTFPQTGKNNASA